MHKTILTITLFVVTSCFSIQSAHSQITFPDNVNDEAPAAPVDGFLAIGLAAGAYFGVRKLRKSK